MKRKFQTMLAAACLSACTAIAGLGGLQAQTVSADYEDGGLYIRLKENTAFAVKSGENRLLDAGRFNFLRAEAKAFGVHNRVESLAYSNNDILSRTIAVTIDSIDRIDAFIERLRQYPEVEMVEKRPVYYICGQGMTPSAKAENETAQGDPAYTGSYKWHLDVINADSAWTLASGKPYIKVAVIDNAIWDGHEDLDIAPENRYNVHTGSNESAPPADVDQEKVCADSRKDCPAYEWSHGTHCAGNVGAVRNNGVGIAAIGSGVTVMGVRCATNAIPGAVSNGFGGVRWAAEHGAKVISMSWGSASLPSQTEQELLKTCYENGIILVAAAGNSRTSAWFYPAASPYVISVGSVDSDKKYSSDFSNYGKWVDILAPGGFYKRADTKTFYSVLSTTFCTNQDYRLSGDKTFEGMYYDGMFGTSMATPVAASLVGLLLSVDSTLNTHQMRELLASTAQIIEDNASRVRDGSGVVDAFAAVKKLLDRRPGPQNFTYTVIPPKGVELSWEAPHASACTSPVAYYRVYRNGVQVKDRLTEMTFSDTDLREGNYTYSVEAVYEDKAVSLRDGVDFYLPTYREIAVEIAPDTTCGHVEGAGHYINGDTVTLTAIPAPGYAFTRWNDGDDVLSREATYRFAAHYDLALTATFRKSTANENRLTAMPLAIYPNPTDGLLYVENLPEGDYEGGVFDLQGRQLMPLHVQGGATLEIPVTRLNKGTFIVKLTAAATGQVRMAKFQKL